MLILAFSPNLCETVYVNKIIYVDGYENMPEKVVQVPELRCFQINSTTLFLILSIIFLLLAFIQFYFSYIKNYKDPK